MAIYLLSGRPLQALRGNLRGEQIPSLMHFQALVSYIFCGMASAFVCAELWERTSLPSAGQSEGTLNGCRPKEGTVAIIHVPDSLLDARKIAGRSHRARIPPRQRSKDTSPDFPCARSLQDPIHLPRVLTSVSALGQACTDVLPAMLCY